MVMWINLTGSLGAAEVRMDVLSHHPAVVLMAVSSYLLHPAAAALLKCCFIIGALLAVLTFALRLILYVLLAFSKNT